MTYIPSRAKRVSDWDSKEVASEIFLELRVKERHMACYILHTSDFRFAIFCVFKTGSCFIPQIGMGLMTLIPLIQPLEF